MFAARWQCSNVTFISALEKWDHKKTQGYRGMKLRWFDCGGFVFVSTGSCVAAVDKAVAETDAGSILPLGRQHSLLNIINVVIHKLGHLIHNYLPKVLQILLCVTATVSTLLDRRDEVIRVGE